MRPITESLHRLQQELQKRTYQTMLWRLQRKHLLFCEFRTWAEVVQFMRRGGFQDARKDDVLRPILEAHSEDGNHDWHLVLFVILWPGLQAIHSRRRSWDRSKEELWQNLCCVFLRVLSRMDLSKRSERLTQKILNDTVHFLYKEYQRIWRRASRESTETSDLLEAYPAVADMGVAVVDFLDHQESEVVRLREHYAAGRINSHDFFLLAATRVYGVALGDCARTLGLTYEATKKRCQRAEARTERFQESCPLVAHHIPLLQTAEKLPTRTTTE